MKIAFLTAGGNCTAVGSEALGDSSLTGTNNNAFGFRALYECTTGHRNCAF